MILAPSRWMPWLLGLTIAGCCFPVREQVDAVICDLAARPLDLTALPPADASSQRAAPSPSSENEAASQANENVRLMSAQETKPKRPAPLRIPLELPGADAPELRLPQDPAERKKALDQLYAQLPPLGQLPKPAPGPNGRPLALADLQQLAQANSPVLRRAAADVEAARGTAIQAGAYPNPTFGYEGDTIGTGSGTPGAGGGYQGGFVEQVIKTAGKLKLAQAAATMDWLNAELALRRAQSDLAGQVRT